MSWVCGKCGSTEISWNDETLEFVCEKCGEALDIRKAKVVVLSTDHISERGTCEACGLENAHLVAKCKKCGKKLCLEDCVELLYEGLCVFCCYEKDPQPREGDNKKT